MDDKIILSIIKIGTLISVILGLIVSAILIYLRIFRRGYQEYIDQEIYNRKLKSNKEEMQKSKPIGDWGGCKK